MIQEKMTCFNELNCSKHNDTTYSIENKRYRFWLWFTFPFLTENYLVFRKVDFEKIRKQEFYLLMNRKLRGY